MTRTPYSPKPSPADRARIEMLKQEARRQRLMALIEHKLHQRAMFEDVMQGETYYPPHVLHHHGTQWEVAELERINATRPASRICFNLPASAYEGRKHAR